MFSYQLWFFIYNIVFLRGKNLSFGTLFLYAIHVAVQGMCYYMIMENCKTMVFSEAIEGFWYGFYLICRYIGDMFIISCVISFFIAYSRKWMWVYILVSLTEICELDSHLFRLFRHSHATQLGVYS